MSTITESIDVEGDVTTAYNQWTQFESFPQFMEGVDAITQVDATHTHWVVGCRLPDSVAGHRPRSAPRLGPRRAGHALAAPPVS